MQKRMFKVLAMFPKKGGGTYWSRCGSGFTNKDDSINIYLDLIPRNFELQLREFDEDELRKRDSSSDASGSADFTRPSVSSSAPISNSAL